MSVTWSASDEQAAKESEDETLRTACVSMPGVQPGIDAQTEAGPQVSIALASFHGTITGYFNHRCRCEPCRAAGSAYQARYRETHPRCRERSAIVEEVREGCLPIAPLEAILRERGLTWDALGGVSGGTVAGWRRHGVPILSADFIACRLGHHPGELWGADWWAA